MEEIYKNFINSKVKEYYELQNEDYEHLKKNILENNYVEFIKNPIFVKSNKINLDEYVYFTYNEPIYYDIKTGIYYNSQCKIIIENNQKTTGSIKEIINLLMFFVNHKLWLSHTGNDKNFKYVEYSNVISIKNFNHLYGHLKDELFCLSHFMDIYHDKNYLPFLKYPLDDEYYKNINFLCDTIIKNNINVQNYDTIKINNFIMIDHHYALETFHSFPKCITYKIINNLNIKTEKNMFRLFLTRDKIMWRNHNIKNINDIVDISIQNNFIIINPENINIETLIYYVKNSSDIIIFFGSALVNLIYSNENTNIIILKSNSYKEQNINIFRNLIKNYKLKYVLMECDEENNIDIPKLLKYI
jgi:hypothetical protein